MSFDANGQWVDDVPYNPNVALSHGAPTRSTPPVQNITGTTRDGMYQTAPDGSVKRYNQGTNKWEFVRGPTDSTTISAIQHTDGGPNTGTSSPIELNKLPGQNSPTSPTGTTSTGGTSSTAAPLQPIPPGAGEEFWGKHGDEFTAPNAAGTYWDANKGFFNTPQPGDAAAREYSRYLQGTPTATEFQYDQNKQSGVYDRPGQGEAYYDATKGDYTAPGAMEKLYADIQGQLLGNDTAALNAHSGNVEGVLNNDTRNSQGFFDRTSGSLAMPGYTERMADQYVPTPSYNENFLTGGGATTGLDSLYSRLESEGGRKLDDRAAAGGAFNSGAALRLRQELNATTNADHVKAVQDASNAADVSKIARLTQGQSLMQGADTALNNRINTGLAGAKNVDDVGFSRATGLEKLYSDMSTEKQNQFKTAGDLANTTQSDTMARILAGSNAATRAQGDTDTRVKAGMAAAGDKTLADATRRGSAVKQLTDADLARQKALEAGGALAKNADMSTQAGLVNAANTSLGVQDRQRQRLNDPFDHALDIAKGQVATYTAGVDKAADEKLANFKDEIGNILKSGGVEATKQTQIMAYITEAAKLGMTVADLGLRAQTGTDGKTVYVKAP